MGFVPETLNHMRRDMNFSAWVWARSSGTDVPLPRAIFKSASNLSSYFETPHHFPRSLMSASASTHNIKHIASSLLLSPVTHEAIAFTYYGGSSSHRGHRKVRKGTFGLDSHFSILRVRAIVALFRKMTVSYSCGTIIHVSSLHIP